MMNTLWDAITHPIVTLHNAGTWILHNPMIFLVAMLIGIILWMFDLNTGKKIAQWSIALYVILSIVLVGI